MHAAPPMLATLVLALALALAFGAAARWLRLPPLFGYLLAGVAISPHTPGFVGDAALTSILAEVGVALLLFGVGLHFRLADLLAVWRVALPGAVLQVGFGTALGGLLGEREIALGIADFAMRRLGVEVAAAQATVDALRSGRPTLI